MNGHSNLPNKTLVTKTYQSDLAHNNKFAEPQARLLPSERKIVVICLSHADRYSRVPPHSLLLFITCICVYDCMCVYPYVCMSRYVYVCVCVCLCMYVYVCMCICMCLSACVSVCVCLFLCLCASACHIIHIMEVKRTWKNWFSPSSPLKLSLDSK